VAYFLLTGEPPFPYSQPIKVLLAHASEEPRPPSAIRADVPQDLEAVILRSLQKRPGDRYQTVLELREALLQCESAGAWTREMASTWWQSASGDPIELAQSEAAPA
ncbi:MAG: hypothetical protein KDA41_15120, partial [Planctomycetales bacterium]|nr:hypothetical protein [Planctomycetales bacterium]